MDQNSLLGIPKLYEYTLIWNNRKNKHTLLMLKTESYNMPWSSTIWNISKIFFLYNIHNRDEIVLLFHKHARKKLHSYRSSRIDITTCDTTGEWKHSSFITSFKCHFSKVLWNRDAQSSISIFSLPKIDGSVEIRVFLCNFLEKPFLIFFRKIRAINGAFLNLNSIAPFISGNEIWLILELIYTFLKSVTLKSA